MKKKIALFFLMFFSFSSCFAKSVLIQLVQDCTADEKIFDSSYLIEQSIMDFMFESGCIVTTAPIFIKSSDSAENDAAFKKVLCDAFDGSMEYVVQVEVKFDIMNSTSPESFLLENIKKVSWLNYNSKTGEKISSGSTNVGEVSIQKNNEQGIAELSADVAARIAAGLK